MNLHLHPEFVEGCYRCDLSRDELPPPHECNAGDFDRVLCGCRMNAGMLDAPTHVDE